MHLDEPVVVGCSAVDHEEQEVVVVVELGPLVEILGVFDRERMKLEHIAEDLKVLPGRLVEVEPEKAAAGEQPLGVFTIEVDLAAALILDDVANRGAGAIRDNSRPRFDARGRVIARWRVVSHSVDGTSTLRSRCYRVLAPLERPTQTLRAGREPARVSPRPAFVGTRGTSAREGGTCLFPRPARQARTRNPRSRQNRRRLRSRADSR